MGALEERRIEEVIPAVREGKFEPVFLPKAEQDVEEGAAGGFVGLHEHDVYFRSAGRAVGLVWAVCGWFGLELGRTVGAGVGHWNPTERKDEMALSRAHTPAPVHQSPYIH